MHFLGGPGENQNLLPQDPKNKSWHRYGIFHKNYANTHLQAKEYDKSAYFATFANLRQKHVNALKCDGKLW